MVKLQAILQEATKMFHDRDVALAKTIFWNWRYKRYLCPILLYPDVHFRVGPKGKIIHKWGRLRMGCRWDIGRFRQSELKINGTLEINGDFKVMTGSFIDVCEGATLRLGTGGMNNHAKIVAMESITFGENVLIGENSIIRDGDVHTLDSSAKPASSPIKLGSNIWIGMNSTILKGITIGDGVMIGANSLVNRDVPPGTFVAGSPARVIRENVQWK
ncbi:MAG: acyltransferase [Deltaproteobacteria bacterium]|nr:acyltransferase [Deltaproteobacteria bacterium]